MVSSVLFYQVHQRLNEIIGCAIELPFAGLLVSGLWVSLSVTTC